MRQLPIPTAAVNDGNSVEMLRVWIANGELYCSINVGMYVESTGVREEFAWGTILADAARHISDGLNKRYDRSKAASLQEIKERFVAELSKPTSEAVGKFA